MPGSCLVIKILGVGNGKGIEKVGADTFLTSSPYTKPTIAMAKGIVAKNLGKRLS